MFAVFEGRPPAKELYESLLKHGDCVALQAVPFNSNFDTPENLKPYCVRLGGDFNFIDCRECASFRVHTTESKPIKENSRFVVYVFATSSGAAVDKAEEILSRLP